MTVSNPKVHVYCVYCVLYVPEVPGSLVPESKTPALCSSLVRDSRLGRNWNRSQNRNYDILSLGIGEPESNVRTYVSVITHNMSDRQLPFNQEGIHLTWTKGKEHFWYFEVQIPGDPRSRMGKSSIPTCQELLDFSTTWYIYGRDLEFLLIYGSFSWRHRRGWTIGCVITILLSPKRSYQTWLNSRVF